MRVATLLTAGAFSAALASCHPFGCGSWRCVDQHEYDGGKHCNAVLRASLDVVRNRPLPPGTHFNAAAVQSQLIYLDDTLASGARLGMSRDEVYRDLDHAKLAYVRSYAASNADPHQKLAALFKDVNACMPRSNPND